MKLTRLALLTLLSCGVMASAQTVQFGAHGGVNQPIGDLNREVDGRLGFTLGGHVAFYYGDGHELRPYVDVTLYNGGWHPVNTTFSKSNVTAISGGADYLYYLENRPQGLYLTMGLGLQNWTVSPENAPNRTKTSLGIAAGAGYRMTRNLSAEGRFLLGQFQSNGGQAVALQGMVSYRF
ncbi:MAG: porin family protein [Firmicutes bacterium]|nr:porin family protein [Bacillota bacterium]